MLDDIIQCNTFIFNLYDNENNYGIQLDLNDFQNLKCYSVWHAIELKLKLISPALIPNVRIKNKGMTAFPEKYPLVQLKLALSCCSCVIYLPYI